MATTSQKIMDIKFLVRMRGARTPPPRIEEPVMNMPLFRSQTTESENRGASRAIPCRSHHRKAYTERDAEICPRIWGYGFEEGADLEECEKCPLSILGRAAIETYVEGLAAAGQEHICAAFR
jgi:hypothetical protein